MSSLRRINASRTNGALSSGPQTPAGLARSSQNALQHGLLAETIVLSTESDASFEQLISHYIARFRPADNVELGFVEQMVAAVWRLRRIVSIETNIFESQLPEPSERYDTDGRRIATAFSRLAGTPAGHLMNRYEARHHRMFERALNNFLLLRKNLPNEPNPANPAGEHSGDDADVEILSVS